MSIIVKPKPGDTVETLARQYLGSEQAAGTIQRANPGLILPLRPDVGVVIPVPQRAQTVKVESEDEIGIVISGERFRFWSRMSLARAIDEVSTVTFYAPFEPENAAFRRIFKPFSYQPVTVQVGRQVVQVGTLMGVTPELSESSSTVAVSAYGVPGVLNDCTPPESDFPIEFDFLDLREIAKSLCEPFGIEVVLEGNPGDVFERVELTAGVTILPFLAGLSEQRGRVLRDDGDGRLVFVKPDRGAKPVAKLKQGQPPVTGVSPSLNPQTYYSHVTGLETQIIGIGAGAHTVTNTRLFTAFRPHVFTVPDSFEAGVAVATEEKIARMFAEAATWTVDVATWRAPGGQLWEPGQIIELEAPRAMIYASYKFMIRRVVLNASSDQRTATLDLIVPEAFTGELPEKLPWD